MSSTNPSLFGQTITLSALINPPQATGRVTFYDDMTVLGTTSVVNGNAALSTILPASGIHTLKARFAGGAVYGPSSSSGLGQTVNVVPATTLQESVSYTTASTINQHIAVADFNGDGKLDIVTNNYTILLGNGDGTFGTPLIYASDSNSLSVVTGDFNGDGKPDFATARYDGNVGVWLSNGDGTFQTPVLYPIGAAPRDIAVGDFNNDGVVDIATASRQGQADGVGILLGVGDGTFRPVVTYLAGRRQTALAVTDFNGDGNADIVSLDSDDIDQVVTILLGAGDGTFQATAYEPAVFPMFVAIGDFNNDGHPDFVVVNFGVNHLSVFLGNGDGSFIQQPTLPLTQNTGGALYNGLAIGDFDGDGNADIAYTGSTGPIISVYLGMGDGTFRGAVNFPAGSGPAGSLVAAEFNGDGKTDIAVTNSSKLQILLAGNGSFPSVPTVSLPAAMGGIPYSFSLNASGGATPYQWSISAGTLPGGLSLSSNGTISGTLPANVFAGIYPFTVMVSDPDGVGFFSSQNLSISLSLGFQISSFPNYVGVVGMPYAGILNAIGGTPPYKNWMVTAGSLPPGLSLDPASGAIGGTPTIPGRFPFTVTVNDSGGLTSLPANLSIFVVCGYTISPDGLGFPASGGTGAIAIATAAGCPWSVSGLPSWVTLTSPVSGEGSATVSFEISANSGGDFSGSFTIAGSTFVIEQQAATIPGLAFIGSMPHIAAEENWTTMFTLVNKGAGAALARLSLFGDLGSPLTIPLGFPQPSGTSLSLLAGSLDRTLAANASLIIDSAGAQTSPVQVGSAQLASTGTVDGFAIFHQIVTTQEAVVPMETRNASSYLLPFDNTLFGDSNLVLGIALANISAQAVTVQVVIRNDSGAQIAAARLPQLAAGGHYQFGLADQFPGTANIRGTIEFDTPSPGQISVLGLRFTPPNNALTTIPALANVGTGGGSIAHLAAGGDGWQTTFVLVNTGASAASATLSFFADQTGAPMPLPLAFPQSGDGITMTVPSYTTQLAAGATLVIFSNGAPTLLTGSAQLTTTGNVSGFVIFRRNDQEAVAPLESRNAGGYIIAFDNTGGTATGIAVNAVSVGPVNIPVTVRDSTGATIATDILTLNANGHTQFTLGKDRYPGALTIRGTIEFDTPSGAQIGALGIRIPTGTAHTYTTLPALAK